MAIKITGLPQGTITVEGAASEATLQQLLAAFNKMSGQPAAKGSAPGPDAAATAANATGNKWATGLQKGAEMAGNAVNNTADLFNRAFTNTTPAIKDFTGILSKYAPVGGKVIETFGNVVGDNVEIFRNLSSVGIDLGDSILQAQLAAGQARLPLDVFGRTVKENANMLGNAFGGATAGAARFAEMQGKLMAQSGQRFAALGFSMDELATYSASYIEQMQRSGRAESMTTAELVAGAERYSMELDRLSKATGISRKQLDDANAAAQRDTRMRLSLSQLGETERAAVTAKMEELKKLDPTGKFAAGFADLIAGNGVALTKEARMVAQAFSQSGVDITKTARELYSGQKGAVDNLTKDFTKASASAKDMTDGSRKTTTALATLGIDTPMYYKASLAAMGDSNKKIAAAKAEQEAKLASKDPTRAVAGLDQTLTEVQNSFKKSLIESKVLDAAANGMMAAGKAAEGAADSFAKMNTTEKLATVFGIELAKQIAGVLSTMLAGYGFGKAGEKIQTKLDDKAKIKEEKERLAKMSPEDRAKVEELKKSEAENLKRAKQAAEEASEKPGMGKRLASFFKGAVKKAGLALLTVGGVTYVVTEFDLAGGLIEGMAGGEEDKKPKAVPLTLEEQRQRDRATTPGAEIPKAVQATPANEPAGPTQIGKASQEVEALKTALKDVDYSKLMFPEAVGNSIDSGVVKLKTLKDTITTTTSAFKDLNNVNLSTLNESISKLSSAVEQQNTASKTEAKPTGLTAAGPEKEMVALLNQLNMSIGQMVAHQSEAVDYLSKTAKNTRQSMSTIA